MSAAAAVAGLGAALAFNNDRASELSSWGGAAAAISVTAFADAPSGPSPPGWVSALEVPG